MHFTIIRVFVLHLLALTLAAPIANTALKNTARDWRDWLGQRVHAKTPQPWVRDSSQVDSIFGPNEHTEAHPKRRDIMGNKRDLAGAMSPSRRVSPPGSQDGVVSKLGKRGLVEDVMNFLKIDTGITTWVDAVTEYKSKTQSILEAIGMQHDALMTYLHDDSNAFGQGLALAKAKLLERIMVTASNKYVTKNETVKTKLGKHAFYTPHSILDLLDKPQSSTFRELSEVTCPDGTTYKGKLITASWELSCLSEYTEGFPVLFSNKHNSEDSKAKVFDVEGDLYHNPMVDDYLETGKMGEYTIVSNAKGNFLGVVQDDGSAGYSLCTKAT